MKTGIALIALLALAAPIPAQAKGGGTQGQFITELKKKEEAAKNDPKALLECASYAKRHGLTKDQDRILAKVLKLDPENEGAHKALGFVKYKGAWLPKAKAEAAEKADTEAEMKAKGLEWVDGVWLPKDQVEDAKKGIFKFENEIVTKEELRALQAGKVRHPRTGELIEKADLEKAAKQFPLGDGKWGDEAEANKYHSDVARPWAVRSAYCTIFGNAALSEIEAIKGPVNEAYETAKRLFGGREPKPAHRPAIYLASGTEDYKEMGTRIGDEGSSYGAFLSAAEVEFPGIAAGRYAVLNSEKDWTPYYARHAMGLAYAAAMSADSGAEFPLWLIRGVGGYAERFYTDAVAAHFGRGHLEKGGVIGMNSFLKNFAINAELDARSIGANIYQAALVLDFAERGGEKASKAAFQAFVAAFEKGGKDVEKAIKDLEKAVTGKDKELREYLAALVKK